MALLTLNDIEKLTFDAMLRCGAKEDTARAIAESIRDAEAEGIRNIGLGFLPLYLEHLLNGKVNGDAVPVHHPVNGSVLQIDADGGWPHLPFLQAFDSFVDLARQQGIAAMSIQHSNSAAVAGWFIDRLARAGLVNLVFANAPATVAAWGGKTPQFGTNPLGFGAPRAGDDPIVVDMATSATTFVSILDAQRDGRAIPGHWAVDSTGQPTTDPQAALSGALTPMSEHKGYGLGLMVDILAAGLTDSDWGFESAKFDIDDPRTMSLGMFIIAISPVKTGGKALVSRIETLVEQLVEQEGVRLPGQRRHTARARAIEEGIEVPEELLEAIRNYKSGKP